MYASRWAPSRTSVWLLAGLLAIPSLLFADDPAKESANQAPATEKPASEKPAVAGDAKPAAETKPADNSNPSPPQPSPPSKPAKNKSARKPTNKNPKAMIIDFSGMIGPRLEQFVARKLESARQQKIDLVILRIDSGGGFASTSVNIANMLIDATWTKTVAFVPSDALSGAALVAFGCEEIVMHPRARLGDIGMITMEGDGLYRYVPEKERSPLIAVLRNLAEERGRSPSLLEAMVDMELVVHEVKHRETGEVSFMSDRDIAASKSPDAWEKVRRVVETGDKRFLTVTGSRAVELGLAEGTVETEDELLQRCNVQGTPVRADFGNTDLAVYILNWPIVTFFLLVIAIIGLYVEVCAPGTAIGGVISAVCFSLFFWSRFLGGTSDWLEVVLFILGIGLLAVELFVIPGFGVTGVTGILLILVSLLMASQNFVIPRTSLQVTTFSNSLLVLGGTGVAVLIAGYFLSAKFGRLPMLNHLALAPPADEPEPTVDELGKPLVSAATRAGTELFVGDWGQADSQLRPAGKAIFGDRYVDVVTDGSFIDRGQQVRIIEIQGNRIVVRAAG